MKDFPAIIGKNVLEIRARRKMSQELLEQYDKLDDYGRHTIAAVMKVEYDRCTEISAPYNGRTGFTSVNIPVEEPVVESLRLNDLKK